MAIPRSPPKDWEPCYSCLCTVNMQTLPRGAYNLYWEDGHGGEKGNGLSNVTQQVNSRPWARTEVSLIPLWCSITCTVLHIWVCVGGQEVGILISGQKYWQLWPLVFPFTSLQTDKLFQGESSFFWWHTSFNAIFSVVMDVVLFRLFFYLLFHHSKYSNKHFKHLFCLLNRFT